MSRVNEGQLRHLLGKNNQVSLTPLVKATLEQPRETWMVPVKLRDDQVELRYRHIRLFKDNSLVLDRIRDGALSWHGVAASELEANRAEHFVS